MLVVSRKVNESILIGDNIEIKLISTGTDKATIGIEAPREILVIRSELLDIIKENKSSAAEPAHAFTHDEAHSIASMMKKQSKLRFPKL